MISGKFTAADQQSADIEIAGVAFLSLTFEGAATVQLLRRLDGINWRVVNTFAASAEVDIVVPLGLSIPYVLRCTAHTDNVDYFLGRQPVQDNTPVNDALLLSTGDFLLKQDGGRIMVGHG